ncbi:MAG: cupin domain-containing protein [Haloarculaceae archaeon]
MGYQKATTGDVDSVMDADYGGMWFLRDALDADRLGVSIMELAPGARGKAHDHAGDGQEEVYVVVDGAVEVELDGETVALGRNEALRVDPGEHRQLFNRGDDRARLVVVGSP